MFKALLFAILIYINMGIVHGQNKEREITDLLIQSFENLSNDKNDYRIEYIESKNSLILECRTEDTEKYTYKIIATDIHPLGIFFLEREDRIYIRLLSIDNGKRFVRERYRNGYRLSNNTNVIDVDVSDAKSVEDIKNTIKEIKKFLSKSIVSSGESIISIPLPKKKG